MKMKTLFMKNETGATSVEFALIMPIFLLLIFGIIELGGAWYQKQMLVHASREAARYTCIDEVEDADEVEDYILSMLTSSGFPKVNEVSVDVTGAGGDVGDIVTVSISKDYTFPVLGNFVSNLFGGINLEAVTVMRHE